jgi:hypothetical protein
MAAKLHQPASGENDPGVVRYDVTLRVGNIEYVVLYTPPDQSNIVEYRLGRDGLVLVGTDTIKFNDMLGRPREVPILRRQTIPAKPK